MVKPSRCGNPSSKKSGARSVRKKYTDGIADTISPKVSIPATYYEHLPLVVYSGGDDRISYPNPRYGSDTTKWVKIDRPAIRPGERYAKPEKRETIEQWVSVPLSTAEIEVKNIDGFVKEKLEQFKQDYARNRQHYDIATAMLAQWVMNIKTTHGSMDENVRTNALRWINIDRDDWAHEQFGGTGGSLPEIVPNPIQVDEEKPVRSIEPVGVYLHDYEG